MMLIDKNLKILLKEYKDIRILHIDDMPIFLESTKAAMQEYFDVYDICNDSLESLNKVITSMDTDNPYDIVVIDLSMPKMMGNEVVFEIVNHAIKKKKQIPGIIIYSGEHASGLATDFIDKIDELKEEALLKALCELRSELTKCSSIPILYMKKGTGRPGKTYVDPVEKLSKAIVTVAIINKMLPMADLKFILGKLPKVEECVDFECTYNHKLHEIVGMTYDFLREFAYRLRQLDIKNDKFRKRAVGRIEETAKYIYDDFYHLSPEELCKIEYNSNGKVLGRQLIHKFKGLLGTISTFTFKLIEKDYKKYVRPYNNNHEKELNDLLKEEHHKAEKLYKLFEHYALISKKLPQEDFLYSPEYSLREFSDLKYTQNEEIYIRANRDILQDVVHQFVSNAYDEIKRSGCLSNYCIELSVNRINKDELQDLGKCVIAPNFGGNLIKISVNDTGSGIEENEILKCFELGVSSKEGGKGLHGFGLHYVLEKSRCCGWGIYVKSSTKKPSGSTFSLIVPSGN